MNKNAGFSQTAAIIAGLVLVIGAGIVWAVTQNKDDAPGDSDTMMSENMESNESDAMMDDKSGDTMMGSEDDMEKDPVPAGEGMMNDDKMSSTDAMMSKPGTYKDYSAGTVEAEQRAGNKVVLFFHATWCPFCKAANEAFVSRANEIPSGVVVLKTDYDSNAALKQKYGVTYQHTFVQIDNDENQLSKWNGGDVDNLKKYLK